jgi:acyl carrier protein
MPISETILLDVRRLVAEVLEFEIEEVQPEASFFADLQGTSLDMLELSFRLEKFYGVRVKFQDLTSDDYKLDERSRLMPESLALLKSKYPFLKLDGFESRPLHQRGEFLTIEAIAGFVQMALAAKPAVGAAAP